MKGGDYALEMENNIGDVSGKNKSIYLTPAELGTSALNGEICAKDGVIMAINVA